MNEDKKNILFDRSHCAFRWRRQTQMRGVRWARSFNTGAFDILDQGNVLETVECLAASLASAHQMPVTLFLAVTINLSPDIAKCPRW